MVSAAPVTDALYVLSVLDTQLGVYVREDVVRAAIDGVSQATIQRTGWAKLIPRSDYLQSWVPWLQTHGDAYQPHADDFPNMIEAWVMPFSQTQFSDN